MPPPYRKKLAFKELVVFATLFTLFLGCLSLLYLSVAGIFSLSEGQEVVTEIANLPADYLSAQQSTQLNPLWGHKNTVSGVSPPISDTIQGISFSQPLPTETPATTKLLSLSDIPPPAIFALPKATNIPEPTFTPTRVVVDTPTSTPTLVPTATSPPPPATPTSTPTPQPQSTHVVIISIDGLRPDALELADTPILDNLKTKGAYCPNAQTVKISETLPSHASMLTGVIPEKHGVLWSLPYMGWPGLNVPTLFSVAHGAGLSTAMVFGKEKLNYLVLPNSVDNLFGVDTHDMEVKDQAIEFIQAGLPDVLFIHFPDTDRVGHAYGWMSSNQLQSVAYVDGLIGEIVATLESEGYLNCTLLIITADHGGHGFRHGDDAPIDRTIPWLAVGPGVPQGVTLGGHIRTYDTAATALYALNLPIPEAWDGRPVLEIFQNQMIPALGQ